MPSRSGSFVFTITLLVPAAACWALPVIDAGPDLDAETNSPVPLQGSITGRSADDYWFADGNHATENEMVKYNSDTGFSVLGPLHDSKGGIFGWPSDLQWVGNTLYGIDTARRVLYTLDPDTGLGAQLGTTTDYQGLGGLAYDSDRDILYAVDWNQPNLVAFNRDTGATTLVMKLNHNTVHGLTWGPTTKLLFGCDIVDGALFTIDVDKKQTRTLATLTASTDEFCEELVVFNGELYGMFAVNQTAAIQNAQLRRIKLPDGTTTDVGPLITDVSAHSLIINSLAERTTWNKKSGPGVVTFDDASNPTSMAAFSKPGDYVLELSAVGANSHVTADVTVHVHGAGGNGASALPGCGIGLFGPGLSGTMPMMLVGLHLMRRRPVRRRNQP